MWLQEAQVPKSELVLFFVFWVFFSLLKHSGQVRKSQIFKEDPPTAQTANDRKSSWEKSRIQINSSHTRTSFALVFLPPTGVPAPQRGSSALPEPSDPAPPLSIWPWKNCSIPPKVSSPGKWGGFTNRSLSPLDGVNLFILR